MIRRLLAAVTLWLNPPRPTAPTGALVLNRSHALMAYGYLYNSHPRAADPIERVLRRHVLAGLFCYWQGTAPDDAVN